MPADPCDPYTKLMSFMNSDLYCEVHHDLCMSFHTCNGTEHTIPLYFILFSLLKSLTIKIWLASLSEMIYKFCVSNDLGASVLSRLLQQASATSPRHSALESTEAASENQFIKTHIFYA